MTGPAWCALAIAAAIAAAAIGHRYHPARRHQHAAQREAELVQAARIADLQKTRRMVAGYLACHPRAWEAFWTRHHLDDALNGGT